MAASLGSRARDMKTISELFQFFKQPLRGKKDAVENPCSARLIATKAEHA